MSCYRMSLLKGRRYCGADSRIAGLIDKRIRPDGIGTLRFGPDLSGQRRSNWTWSLGSDNTNYGNQNTYDDPYALTQGTTPVFVDIDDAASVYRIVTDLHEKRRTAV